MTRPHLFVATHHKSGTVWMLTVFQRLAKVNGFQFFNVNEKIDDWARHPQKLEHFEQLRAKVEAKNDKPAVFFDYQGLFPDLSDCIHSRGAAGIHIIRDPRDMLLSAVRFHLKADEPWLHEPREELGGLTYQQQLAAYDTLDERIRFEMDNNMGWVIKRMHRFDGQGVIRDVRYEDLIIDTDMTLWHELCIEMGLGGKELINAIDAFWSSSVFGAMKQIAESGEHSHIKNARPQQWRTLMSEAMVAEVEERFGDEITGLGYELSNQTAGARPG